MTEDELLAISDCVLALAGPGEQVEAVVTHGLDTEIRAYDGEVESLSSAASAGVGVRVVADGRQGFAWAGTFDDDVLVETLAEARDNAAFGTVDEHLGLAEPDGVAPADLDLFRTDAAEVPTDAKVALAIELERAVLGADARISGIESAEYVDVLARSGVVTTTGIRHATSETACYLAAYALAGDEADTQTGFGFSLGRPPDELDVDVVAADAARRATRLLGATQPPSGRTTLVLDPWVTAQLLGIIGSTLSGEAVLKGRSVFGDRLGEQVAAEGITLVDDPTRPEAFTATTVDGEGLATRRNLLIEDGQLRTFVHNAYTARRAGTASTGSAVRSFKRTPGVGCMALALTPGTRSQAELIASIDHGILVTDVAGLHSGVNPVSGDFSTGAEGLDITDGQLGQPRREFTIASTLQRMLLDVVEVGADLVWLPMSAAGVSLVLRDVTVSGS